MKYSVVIVDDEDLCITSLKTLIDWGEMDYEVVASFSNSMEAFNFICKNQPNLAFVDVRMPCMSGIEIIEKSKKLGVITTFIIVSGYSEFQYAQMALRAGASDYLLKPVGKNRLISVLENLNEVIDEVQISHDFKIVEQLMSYPTNPLGILKEYNIQDAEKYWISVVINSKSISKFLFLKDEIQAAYSLFFYMDKNRILLLYGGDSDIRKQIFDRICELDLTDDYVGFSEPFEDLSEISNMINEAEVASCSSFISVDKKITLHSTSGIDQINQKLNLVGSLFEKRNIIAVLELISYLKNMIYCSNYNMYHVVYIYNKYTNMLRSYCDESFLLSNIGNANCADLINRFDSLESMCEYLVEITYSAFSEDACETKYYSGNFSQILNYINDNYAKKITLNQLADIHYLNMTYCCGLFKKNLGKTFSEYLTELRLKKAYALMQAGELSIDEISEKVGYANRYYFSRQFKKYYGISPTEVKN